MMIDVKVHNRVLPQAEIQAAYREGVPVIDGYGELLETLEPSAFFEGSLPETSSPLPATPEDPRKAIKAKFLQEGLEGVTIKYSINEYDFYLQLALYDGQVDFIAITLSGVHEHNIRALMEVVCRMATRALRRGAYTLEELCNLWEGYEFAPYGQCPQLLEYGSESPLVKSPIDAAAKIMRLRFLSK